MQIKKFKEAVNNNDKEAMFEVLIDHVKSMIEGGLSSCEIKGYFKSKGFSDKACSCVIELATGGDLK